MKTTIVNLPAEGSQLFKALYGDKEKLEKFLRTCAAAAEFPRAVADRPYLSLMVQNVEFFWVLSVFPATRDSGLAQSMEAALCYTAEKMPETYGTNFREELLDGEFPLTHEFGRLFAIHEQDKQRNLAILQVTMEGAPQ